MNKVGFVGDDDVLDQDGNGFYVVRAGLNGFCDTEILDREMLDTRVTCPEMIDPQTAVNEMNDLLRKLGVVADVNIQVMPLLVNYDVIKDDGILQVNNTINGSPEILAFQHKRHILDGTPPSDMGPVRAYIIPELNASFTQGDLEGIAYAGFGMHNLMLNDKKADGAILLHETGHAKWSFFHPRDMNPINNRPEVDDDKMNFMYFNSAGRTNNFRRYQFNLIRQ